MKDEDTGGKGRPPGSPEDLLEEERDDAVVEFDDEDISAVDIGDDLPETVIEVDDDEDEVLFDDFDDVDVYEGLPAEEDIAFEVEDEEDEEVVVEAGPDVEVEELEAGEEYYEEEKGWSAEQWSECAAKMVEDAKGMEDPDRAARLLAGAGRVYEVYLGDAGEAMRLFRSANELDATCLIAVQGLRRLHLAEGDLDSARMMLQDEQALTHDDAVRLRLESIDLEMRTWKLGEQEEAGKQFQALRGSDDADAYVDLVRLSSALMAGNAGEAHEAARAVAGKAVDGLFVSSLQATAGLLAEVAGDTTAAAASYRAALDARDTDEIARSAMWRLHVVGKAWAEAQDVSSIPGIDTSSRLGCGHVFMRAAQQILALGRVSDAREFLAPLPGGIPEHLMKVLASLEDGEVLSSALGDLESVLPEGRLNAVLAWGRAAGAGDGEAVEILRSVVDQAPELDGARLELVRRLSSEESAERSSLMYAVIDDALVRHGSAWLVQEAALTLLENGRIEEATRLLDRAMEAGAGEGIVWCVLMKVLALGDCQQVVRLLEAHTPHVSDNDLRRALEIARSVLVEFEVGDPGGAAALLAHLKEAGPVRGYVFNELVFGAGREAGGVDAGVISAGLEGEGARAVVPAVLALLRAGGVAEAGDRIDLLRRLLVADPDNLVAFAALRRELLAARLVEEYGRELDGWVGSAEGGASGRMQGERIALLSLGAGASLSEDELRSHLEESSEDSFLPLFIAGLEGFPSLAAESTERIASGLDGPAADRWWYDAARRWAAVDFHKAVAAIGHVGDPAWRAAANGLLEAASWVSGRWDEVAGRLIGLMKEVPEGETSEDILSRMVYVDGFLKGETSMALAEAGSLLEIPGVGSLFCLRFLYSELIAQGRAQEVGPPAEAIARTLAGSEESTAFAWLATRVWRDEPKLEERADGLLREILEARAQDLPLLLMADAQARRKGDQDLLVSVMSEMAGALEGDWAQGAVMWVLALLFADRDPERALSMAREAQEKLPTNPLAALLVEQLATTREDWATVGAFARQAASLTRQLAFGVEDYLRAGGIYRDRLKEDGWAVQCFEAAVSLDPTDPRGFDTLREHFEGQGDWDHVAKLLEDRILATEEPAARHELLRTLASVYERAGRRDEAIASLRRVLSDQPEDPASLDSLGELCIRSGLWEEAVNTLQERAMLPMTEEESVDTFRKLGGLYVDHMPNNERAIVCFEKVISIGGKDLEVMRQLVALYEKTGAWEKGLKVAELLYNDAQDDEEKARWLVVAGRLWQTGGGDLRRAEQTFEMARKLVPGAAEPIVSLVRLYREQGDSRALSFHLERSFGDLQLFAKSDPGNLSLYHTVFQIARETGVARDIRIAGVVLESLFDMHVDEQVPYGDAGGRFSWQPGPWLIEPELDERIAPRSFTPSFRVLVARLKDVIVKSVAYDPKQYGISRGTRLQKRASSDTKLLEDVANHFNVKPPQVHLTDLIPNCLTVLSDSPPILVVGEPLYRTLGESQKRFAFAWGCKLSAAGLVPFVSMTETNMPALWVALMQQFEPSFFISGVDANEVTALSASLRKNFPRKAREELLGPALECSGDQLIDVSSLHADISTFADSAALLASGDIGGALQFVWQVSSMEEPFASDFAASKALRESPALARLMEFVVSGRFARCLPGEE